MYQIDFHNPISVHFIGIGGISMSGLAQILLKEGFSVSGSDMHESALTERLMAAGARIFIGQRPENIDGSVGLVVYTAAVHPDNPEYAEAVRLGLPILSRAELLGQMMKNYGQAVAVAGTHGKTTTTSMITEIVMEAGLDPTVSVGGMLPSIGGNYRIGSSGLMVAEACEYTNSFLSFFPTIAVILNVEEDHLDFFADLADIRRSFQRFAALLPADGRLVINADIPDWRELAAGLSCPVTTFSLSGPADFSAGNISYDALGCASFALLQDGEEAGRFSLNVPGEHNVVNALAAVAAARAAGASLDNCRAGLRHFRGTERRFEKKGEVCGVTIVDDYAHHPQEIAATLAAAGRCSFKKLWCVFQPHTYTRTKAFLDEFAEALSAADEVVLAPVYPARETDTLGVSSQDIADRIAAAGGSVHCFGSFDDIENFLLESCSTGDLLITMGAGDVVKIGERLLGL